MAGEIIAVGADVKEWKVGDRVCANLVLDRLHNDSIAEAALGGSVQGVLTQYRTFPAQVRSLVVSRGKKAGRTHHSPLLRFQITCLTRRLQPYRQ